MEGREICLYLLLLFCPHISMSDTVSAELVISPVIGCEAGWNPIGGECVAIVYASLPTTFDKAMRTCQYVNATLPIVHSQSDWNRRVDQINQSGFQDSSWLGLAYNPQNNTFRWMDGSGMNWDNFAVPQNNVNRMITNCVFTSRNFKWYVQECSNQAPFVCIKPSFVVTSTSSTVKQTMTTGRGLSSVSGSDEAGTMATTAILPLCSDQSSSGTGCVLGQVSQMTWQEARTDCRQQNRTLVYTRTRDEWIQFQAIRTTYPNMDNIWIGLRYNQSTKQIELSEGNAWRPSSDDWFPWSSGQPPTGDTLVGDSCVASTKQRNYLWTFENCNQSSYAKLCYSSLSSISTANPDLTMSTSPSMSIPRSSLVPRIFDQATTVAASKVSTGPTAKPRQFVPKMMNEAERVSSIVVQSMGCVFIIGGISITLFLFLVFRNMSVEKIIIANQDIALLFAHCFVLTLREPALYPSMSAQLCKTVAVLLHYFFTCSYTFMLMEALQMMYILGHLNKSGSILPTYIILAIGWGCPLALVAITGPVIGDEYSTPWTCWGDLERRFGWALFFPMICICSMTVVIVESAGMMNRQDPPTDADPIQLFSAKISQRGIIVVMSLTVASHVLGIVAVYFQQVFLYVACFGLNVSCGTAVVFFHTAVDSKMRSFVVRIWKKIKNCERRSYAT